MAAEVAQVAQRCDEAKRSRELMLNSCGLRKFPDAVFFLLSGVEIQVLSLADNQFPKLPAKVASSPVFVSITSEYSSQCIHYVSKYTRTYCIFLGSTGTVYYPFQAFKLT